MYRIKTFILMVFIVISSYCNSGQNAPYLSVQDVSDDGLLLDLDDGSEWSISYYGGGWILLGYGWTEQYNVLHWNQDDKIEIQYPGSGNYIDFVLLLINKTKQEHVWAHLKSPPKVDNPNCLSVIDFDKDLQKVSLSDGSNWLRGQSNLYGAFFYETHHYPLNDWQTGDLLTKISPEGWLVPFPYLLWNHRTHEIVPIYPIE